MNTLKNIWNWLSGKKTAYGFIGICLVAGLDKLGLISPEIALWLYGLTASLTGVGVAHKGAKGELI